MEKVPIYHGSHPILGCLPDLQKNTLFFNILLYVFTFMFLRKLILEINVTHNYENYTVAFQHLPEHLTFLRYIVSNLIRIIGIGLCIGLLFKKPFSRQGMVYYSVFGMMTAFFRHPYESISSFSPFLWSLYPSHWFYLQHWLPLNPTSEQLAWGWVFIFGLKSFMVYLVVFLFLILPSVKVLFQPKTKT